jgi:tripartite-type tricarboxylate transporter receptor subunit TctC
VAQRHRPRQNAQAIVAKLSNELIRILRLPEVKERFNSQGLDAVGSKPDEVSALIKKVAMYAKLVKQIGFQPQ